MMRIKSRRRVVLASCGSALAVGLMIAVLLWPSSEWPRGDILGVFPLSQQRALFVYFDGDYAAPREGDLALLLRDANGATLWASEHPQTEAEFTLTALPNLNQVALRTTVERIAGDGAVLEPVTVVQALGLDEGASRWVWWSDSPLFPDRVSQLGDAMLWMAPRFRTDDQVLEIMAGGSAAVSLDPQSGRELWRASLPGNGLGRLLFLDDAVLIDRGSDGLIRLSRRGPEPVLESLAASSVCVVGEDVVFADCVAGRLFLAPLADLSQRVEITAIPGSACAIPRCGRQGDQLVLVVDTSIDLEPRAEVVVVDTRSLQVSSSFPINGTLWHPDLFADLPFSGVLDRFALDIATVSIQPFEQAVILIDFEQQEVVWYTEPQDLVLYATFRVGDRLYLRGDSGSLALFDGHTGALLRAIRIADSYVTPEQFSPDGAIWIASGEDFVVLDAATLRPVTPIPESLTVADTTAEIRAWLGQ